MTSGPSKQESMFFSVTGVVQGEVMTSEIIIICHSGRTPVGQGSMCRAWVAFSAPVCQKIMKRLGRAGVMCDYDIALS